MKDRLHFEHSLLKYVGFKLSLHVYIFHMFVLLLVERTYGFLHIYDSEWSTVLIYLKPIFVVTMTILFSFFVLMILSYIGNFKITHNV